MTNKEKAIQQAYGDYWEQVKDYTDSDGWFNRANLKYKDCLFLFNGNRDLYETNFKGYFRPKSLRGLENNNDWIKIQPEFYFPNEDVWVINLNGNKIPLLNV
jgi:hypothetical protein